MNRYAVSDVPEASFGRSEVWQRLNPALRSFMSGFAAAGIMDESFLDQLPFRIIEIRKAGNRKETTGGMIMVSKLEASNTLEKTPEASQQCTRSIPASGSEADSSRLKVYDGAF